MRQWTKHHCSAPSHYLKQCWNIGNSNLRNKLQWNRKRLHTFSNRKMDLKMSSAKWRSFFLSPNMLKLICVFHLSSKYCVSTKLTFVMMFYAWCVFCAFGCTLNCVSFEFTFGWCVLTLSLRCYLAHGEHKMVSNQHTVNTQKIPNTRLLAPLCWVIYIYIYISSLLQMTHAGENPGVQLSENEDPQVDESGSSLIWWRTFPDRKWPGMISIFVISYYPCGWWIMTRSRQSKWPTRCREISRHLNH